MKIFRSSASVILARQRIHDKLYGITVSAVIECLKKHDYRAPGTDDLTIRIVGRDMIDFKLDPSLDWEDYAVYVSVERVVYNDEKSFVLHCRDSRSFIIRSDAGMKAPFIYIRDFFRLLNLIKSL